MRHMLSTLMRALRTPTPTPASLDDAIPRELESLRRRVALLEDAEAQRAAEHHAMVDQLSRLYKRLATRIARETNGHASEESPLQLRNRLGRNHGL